MKTSDQILKIKSTILYILEKFPEGIDYIRLFKIMYFAQRQHLVVYGSPLMEDTFVARKLGPVPAFSYKVVKYKEGALLDKCAITEELMDVANSIVVSCEGDVKIVKKVSDVVYDEDELSVSNIKMLDTSIEFCKSKDSKELSKLSHDKAWKFCDKIYKETGENIPMTYYKIAEAGDATKSMLKVIKDRQMIKADLC